MTSNRNKNSKIFGYSKLKSYFRLRKLLTLDYGNYRRNIYNIVLRINTIVILSGKDSQSWLLIGVYGTLLLANALYRLSYLS